jgi:hypothetical protein
VGRYKQGIFVALIAALGLPLLISHPAFAADGVSQVQNFMQNTIKIFVGLAGMVAAGFIVVGGFGLITSAGNPERLDKSRRTLLWAGIGLAVCFAAFVLSDTVAEQASKVFGS